MQNLIPDIPLECISLKFQVTDKTHFPFPYIPAKLTLPTIAKDDRTATSEKSATETSTLVRSLALPQVDQGLEHLYLSATLFRNLIAYADPSNKLPGTEFDLSTLGITPDGMTEASGTAIARAAFSMYTEAQAMALRQQVLANSQLEIQNQVVIAMFPLMDCAIAQRYLLEDPNGGQIPRTNMPRWRANTYRADYRMVPGTLDAASGLADGILDAGQPGTANAILHCKPSWVYSEEKLVQIFEIGVLENDDGSFKYLNTSTGGHMMTQFWGSFVTMGCNFGIWSNGSKIFFAVRRGNDLICTPLQQWAQRDTVRAMMGLTYASLDAERWQWDQQVDLAEVLVGQTTLIKNA